MSNMESLEPRALLSVTWQTVADLETTTSNGPDPEMPAFGTHLTYFMGYNTATGNELWVTDGTQSGTHFVKDITPGPENSRTESIVAINDVAFLSVNNLSLASTDVDGLWRSDGTAAGTTQVTYANQIPIKDPSQLTALGGTLYFWGHVSDPASQDFAVFKLDAQPNSVAREISGTRGLHSDSFSVKTTTNDAAWFIERTSLMKIPADGSTVQRLPGFGNVYNVAPLGNRVILRAEDSAFTGIHTWLSDGTASGTVEQILPTGAYWDSLTMLNDGHYAFLRATVTNQFEVWVSGDDGIATLSFEVPNSSGGPGGKVLSGPGGQIYFTLLDQNNQRVLWQTDATLAGTMPVSAVADITIPSQVTPLLRQGNFVYFVGTRNSESNWYSMNTATSEVLALSSYQFQLYPGPGRVLASSTGGQDSAVWFSDGLHPLARIYEEFTTLSSTPRNLVDVDGKIYGLIDPVGAYTHPVFQSDGTNSGTVATSFTAENLYPTTNTIFAGISIPSELFVRTNGQTWKPLSEISPAAKSYGFQTPTVQGDKLYYTQAFTDPGQDEKETLWVTDGTANGSFPLLSNDRGNSSIVQLAPLGTDQIIFIRMTGTNTGELWRTDGTVGGTIKIQNLTDGTAFNDYRQLLTRSVGNKAIAGQRDANGILHWLVTDGSVSGTKPLVMPQSSTIAFLTESDGILYFASRTSDRYQLWKTNGTNEGTQLITSLTYASDITDSTVIDGRLFFAQSNISTQFGNSIWVSDGTSAGTQRLVSNLRIESIGRPDANAILLKSAFGRLFFFANDGVHGRRLWMSDGTTNGTKLVRTSDGELVPFPSAISGNDGSDVMLGLNGALYYTGYTREFGAELIRLESDTIDSVARGMKLSGGNSPHVIWDAMFGATAYDVQIIPLQSNAAGKTILRTTATSWNVPEAYRDRAFRVWVRGVGTNGNLGPWNVVPFDVTTGTVPVIHGTPALTVLAAPTVKWANPPGTTATEIWVGDRELNKRVAWATLIGGPTSFNVPPLVPARYAVWVRTTGSYGTSDWSAAFDFTILTPAPVVSVVSDTQRHLSVTWTSISEIQGYELVVRRAGATLPFLRISLPAGTHSYQFAAPVPGDQYTVWVRGTRNGRGYTAWNAGTSLLIRQAPTPRLTLPTISWNAIAQASAYEVVIRDRIKNTEVFRATTASPTVNVGATAGPGFYELTITSLYADGQASQASMVQFEVSHPVVRVTPVPLPTVDATPVIGWIPAAGAASYEIFISRNSNPAAVYRVSGLTGSSHRVSVALPPDDYQLWIRAHYSDGTRSIWGPSVPLSIGAAPKVTMQGRTLQWNSVRDATRYDVLVQYETRPGKYSDVVRTQSYYTNTLDTSDSSTWKQGRYRAWVRAIRDEAGERYLSRWSSIVAFELS